MQCFRLSHAGIVLEASNASLLIDPGNFSSRDELTAALSHAAAPAGIVITHEHPDHWLPEHIGHIRELAPACPIFTTRATAAAISDAANGGAANSEATRSNVTVVAPGQTASAGPFDLEFYGGTHEVIHSSIQVIDNIGVRVNGLFAYGGDSLVPPPFAADVLGIPIGAPWSNIGQVIDFVLETRPQRAYLTHDGMLSEAGRALFTAQVSSRLEAHGGQLLLTRPPAEGTVFPIDL